MQQAPTPPPPVDILAYVFVFCTRRHLKQIVEEFHDQYVAEKKAVMVLYGQSGKGKQGFLILAWTTPIPSAFMLKLATDPDFLDYVRYDRTSPIAPHVAQ